MSRAWFSVVVLALLSETPLFGAELSGRVIDRATRSGIPGVYLSLEGVAGGTYTSSGGAFRFTGLDQRVYRLHARIPGYSSIQQDVHPGTEASAFLTLELDQSAYPVDPVVVTATRDPSRVMDVPASISVVPATQLARSIDLEQALELLPGVLTRSYGTLGDVRSVSIRGSTAGQVLVLVDGRRVNNAQLGEVDLSTIPLGAVERIEVVRGSASALYGADAVGGVVNIITAGASADSVTRVGLSMMEGSFGTRDLAGNATVSLGNITSLISARHITSQGDFPYVAPDGTEHPRANAAMKSNNVFGKFTWSDAENQPAQRGSISAEYIASDAGSPGTIDQPSIDSHKENRSGSIALAYERRLGSPFSSAYAQLYYNNAIFNYNDPMAYVPVRSASHNTSLGGEARAKTPLTDWSLLTGGYAFRIDQVTGSSLADGRSRRSHGAYGQMEIAIPIEEEPWIRRIVVTPALRWDRFSDFGSELSPRIGVVATAGVDWQVSLKGVYGKSFRAPTFNDLYWPKDNFAAGNPLLTPEHGTDREVSLLARLPVAGLGVDVTWFQNSLTDMILWQSSGGGIWTPKNIGEADLRGIETKIAVVPIAQHIFLDWNYTYLDARNRTDRTNEFDMQLVYRAKHVHHLSARFEAFGARLMATMQYVGKRFTTPSNTTSLPPYRTTDLLAGYRIALGSTSVDLSMEALNIEDIRYQAVDGYPMPGREFRMTLRIMYENH